MNCQNCKHPFESNDLFCNQCGAQLQPARLTIGNIFRDFSERYFSFDNKFIKTCIALFKQPEEVVNGYINGLRIRYVNPITFLIISITLSSIQVLLIKNGYLDFGFVDLNPNEKNPFDMKKFNEWSFDHQNMIMFATIPFLALISRIVFFGRKEFNFAEHNLIYFYTYSVCTIAVLVLVVPFFLVFDLDFIFYVIISFSFMILYHVYALKRIFSLTRKQIFYKTLLFLVVAMSLYLAVIIIATICFFIYAILTGGLNLPK